MKHHYTSTLLVFVFLILFLFSCNKPHQCKELVEQELPVAGFHTIRLCEAIRIGVTVCDTKKTSLQAKGCPTHMKDLELTVKDSVLTAKYTSTKAFGAITKLEIMSPVEIKVVYFKTSKILRIDNLKKETPQMHPQQNTN